MTHMVPWSLFGVENVSLNINLSKKNYGSKDEYKTQIDEDLSFAILNKIIPPNW